MHELTKSGRHMIVDGFADQTLLRDRARLKQLLCSLAHAANMEIIDLKTYPVPENADKVGRVPFEDPGGVTGYAVLTTSHASIHTFPQTGEFKFDLYSCTDFDPTQIADHIAKELGVSKMEQKDWIR